MNPQPSEHAMRTAHQIFEEQADVLRAYELIDTHAIESATRELREQVKEAREMLDWLETADGINWQLQYTGLINRKSIRAGILHGASPDGLHDPSAVFAKHEEKS